MKLVITNQGQQAVSELLAGKSKMQFTKAQLSDHDYTGVDLKSLCDVLEVKQEALISGVSIVGKNLVELITSIDNTKLIAGYYIKTIGVFAKLDSGKEILFAVTTDSRPYYLPVLKGKSNTAVEYKFDITIADTAVINVTVDPAATPTISQVEELQSNKVDKVNGKGLSTEDFTSAHKNKLDHINNFAGDATIEILENVVVPIENWNNDFTFADYPFKAVISNKELTEEWLCILATPNLEYDFQDILAPYIFVGKGMFSIYATTKKTVAFQNIVFIKKVGSAPLPPGTLKVSDNMGIEMSPEDIPGENIDVIPLMGLKVI